MMWLRFWRIRRKEGFAFFAIYARYPAAPRQRHFYNKIMPWLQLKIGAVDRHEL